MAAESEEPAAAPAGAARTDARPATEAPVSERLVVGLVRGLHGLRGGVRIEVLTDDPARFEPGSVVYAEGEATSLTVAWVQPEAPGILVRFEEIPTRDHAERLRDTYLEAEASSEALPDGAVYWHQVMDAQVATNAGELLGTVQDIFRAGEAEVFVVRGGERGEVLVPAVRDVVTDFAPDQNRLTVDADVLGLEPLRPRRRRGRRSSKEPIPGSATPDEGPSG